MVSEFPSVAASKIPCVNRTQMIEVDRVMIEDLGIELVQMMENAGRALALVCKAMCKSSMSKILIVAGRGGNGGGAITAGRRLACGGYDVTICITSPTEAFSGVPRHQLDICTAMGVPVIDTLPGNADDFDLIVDGVIGYSLNGAPRGQAAVAIDWINARKTAKCVSLDVPAGFDAMTGQVSPLSVSPDAVVTLAAPKLGQRQAYSTAKLYLADISVPQYIIEKITRQPFMVAGDIVQLV